MNKLNKTSRVLMLANYILNTNSTIRKTGKYFSIPKSTVHHDLYVKLKVINPSLYFKVQNLMQKNFSEKHIHGGEATKQKYIKLIKNKK